MIDDSEVLTWLNFLVPRLSSRSLWLFSPRFWCTNLEAQAPVHTFNTLTDVDMLFLFYNSFKNKEKVLLTN